MFSTVLISLIAIFSICSCYYVYRYRGQVRFSSFKEYWRKGWPIFSPMNCLLYCFTRQRARTAIIDMQKFPELQSIQDNWQTIRDEALQLLQSGSIQQTADSTQAGHYDIGFRTFYKYGWRKFYLNWYGYTHASAARLCPKTTEILKKVPCINGAMFSLLPAGGKLTRHLDPVAASLRYHLGLSTPQNANCAIEVDGTKYAWQDGNAFMFDETYLHHAYNNSQQDRLIMMCDVNRPTHSIGTIANYIIKKILKASVVPNTNEDKQGMVNRCFYKLNPIIKNIKNLKNSKPTTYKIIKHSINSTLIIMSLLITAGAILILKNIFTH